MLEKPDIQDAKIVDCLRNEYGLNAVRVIFLPIGNDRNTAVYRAVASGDAIPVDANSCFVKLRRGNFDESTIEAPRFLHNQGIKQIIAPCLTRSHRLWVSLGEFALTVSPYIEGCDGYEVDLLDRHWIEFGHALKQPMFLSTRQMIAFILSIGIPLPLRRKSGI